MANFDVAARTLIHLGAELITSDEIAIYELIKNAFDAESQRVSIHFEIPLPYSSIEECLCVLKDKNKNIEICKSEIIQILKHNNREEINQDRLNKKIDRIRNASSSKNVRRIIENINCIKIMDTGCGMSATFLDSVFLRIGTDYKLRNSKKDGRVLLGNKGIGRLSMMRLGDRATIKSWVKNENKANQITFNWKKFEDPEKSISDINFPIRARNKPSSSPSGTNIRISALKSSWDMDLIKDGLVNKFLRRLRNPFDERKVKFPIDVTFNSSQRIAIAPLDKDLYSYADRHLVFDFFPSASSNNESSLLKTTIVSLKGNQDEMIDIRTYSDVCKKLNVTKQELNNIGKLRLIVRWYNRKNLAQMGFGKDLKKIRAKLDNWAGGIAVYRDGFRVGLTGSDNDGDWLDLDKKALKGAGYTVNRIQTIGALEITQSNNPRMIDRSNREGLIKTEELDLLKKLLLEFPIKTLKEVITTDAEENKKQEMAVIIEDGTESIEGHLNKASENISYIRKKLPEGDKGLATKLSTNLHHIKTEVQKFDSAVQKISQQSEDILELAGVGTVMHSVMHELARTTAQTRNLLSEVSKNTDGVTKELLSKLESEIKSINTRLRQLDPLSPDGRQRKSTFDVVKLTRTIIDGYENRFQRHNISTKFTVDDCTPDRAVKVKMVKGFYSLAIENLLTNSVFWLQDRLMAGETVRTIRVDIDSKAKVLTVFDNGPGISPNDKERIFNPGFSLKPQGNGYGLYIAKEVAKHHDATLVLDSIKEVDGRYHTFVLELPR